MPRRSKHVFIYFFPACCSPCVGAAGFPDQTAANHSSSNLRCDTPAGRVLSLWQTAKKALWDHVRGPCMEATAQPPLLAHIAWTLEKASFTSEPREPGFVQQCPLGLICIQLFLLEVSTHSTATLASWAEKLLLESLQIPWSEIVFSEWPLFVLLYRIATGKGEWPLLYDSSPKASGIAQALKLTADATAELIDWAWRLLPKLMGTLHNVTELGRVLLVPEAAPLWGRLAELTEERIQERALGPPSPARNLARYFLERLHSEFAGSACAVVVFVRSLLTESARLPLHRPLHCWDVGAGSFVDSATPLAGQQEVWELCLAFGSRVRAFEASRKSYERLAARLGAVVEHLAVANYTGWGRLIGSGQSTDSLGSKACGLWVSEEECAQESRWEDTAVTTIDALLGPAPASIDILKVDVEGGDWEVVLGARQALAEGRIGAVILEYGDKWSPDIASAVKHMAAAHYSGPSEEPGEPSLQGVARWFARHHYSSYLLGTKTLIPIDHKWWHAVYEMCKYPHQPHYYGIGNVCWMDVTFVHESHHFAKLVRSMVKWDAFAA